MLAFLIGSVMPVLAATTPYFVVDFAPVDNLQGSPFRHWLTFCAERPDKKPLKWVVDFKPEQKTPAQVRDAAFESLKRSNCEVKKVGETKLLFYGCKTFAVVTEQPGKKQFDEKCRPTIKEYATEKEALEAK